MIPSLNHLVDEKSKVISGREAQVRVFSAEVGVHVRPLGNAVLERAGTEARSLNLLAKGVRLR